ncbi:hypothetical protein BJX64DRAFT_278786 [Aspergillus heterothallicus]
MRHPFPRIPALFGMEPEMMLEVMGAQRFRRALHDKFGLAEWEWKAVQSYFANYEAVGVATQRGEWLEKECSRLRCLLRDSTTNTAGDDSFISRDTYPERRNELYRNKNELGRRVGLLWKACLDIQHTPLGRAMRECRRKEDWHLHPWMRQQCIQAGGCCGRESCACCMEYGEVELPISLLQDPIELGYSIPPVGEDLFGQRMLEFTVWRC